MNRPTDEEIEKELNRQLRSWDTHVGISAGEAYINGFKACAKWARDQQPKFKPLEWIQMGNWIMECRSPFGSYFIVQRDGRILLELAGQPGLYESVASIDAAKDKAQSDYERRINELYI
jgi:hypothetical protein